MSQELDSQGPANQRRTDRTDQRAPAWPVLAQLPRVGAVQAAPRDASPTFAPQPQAYDAASLEVVEPAAAAPAGRQIYMVDSPHRSAPKVEAAVRAPQLHKPEAAPSPSATKQSRHFRVDHAAGHRPPGRVIETQREVATISGSIFRLHAALAPHMGLVGAAALVIAGGVLFWTALVRPNAATTPDNPLNFNNGLSREAAAPANPDATGAALPSASALDAPPINWATPPHVANAAAAAAPAAETERPAAASSTPQPNAGDGPSLTPTDPAAASQEPITTTSMYAPVTPTPQCEGYPITPFPAFTFVASPPMAETSPAAAVAERPVSPSTAPNATR